MTKGKPWFSALRERRNQDFDGDAHLTNEELDALVDIAEAAHQIVRREIPIRVVLPLMMEANLLDALAADPRNADRQERSA